VDVPVALTPRRVAAALLAVAVAGSAAAQAATTAAATDLPAAGISGSQITLLDLSVAGQAVSVGRLTLNSGMADGTVTATPLIANGTSYGAKSLSIGSAAVPSMRSDALLPAPVSRLVTVTTPGASMTAGNGFARAGTSSLGSVNLLGLPLAIDGTASASTAVSGVHAGAEKVLTIRNLALPSIADLLGGLGLDITKLPADTLAALVDKLGLVDPTIASARTALEQALAPIQPQLTAAQQQVGAAQAAVASANDTLAGKQAELAAATSTASTASQTLQTAVGSLPQIRRAALLPVPTAVPALPLPLASGLPGLPTVPGVLPTSLPTALPTAVPTTLPVPSLPAVLPPAAQPLVDAFNAANAAYSDALAQVNAATGALNLANGLLNSASAAVNTLLANVSGQTAALVQAITSVLGKTPLVSVDRFTISTEATATSARAGGQKARVVAGEIQGVHVLGNDVLTQTLHRDRVAVTDLTGAPLALVNQRISELAAGLSSTLSNVPGLPSLTVPAPQVQLLTVSTSTGVAEGFGKAGNLVHALKITVPGLTIPSAVQVPAAPGLLSVQAVGDLLTKPLVIGVGVMHDSASFRPAGVPGGSAPPAAAPLGGSTPTTPAGTVPPADVPAAAPPTVSTPGTDPQLPRTGLGEGAGLLALGFCAAGLLLYRRTASIA
jgi:hypothetical protein